MNQLTPSALSNPPGPKHVDGQRKAAAWKPWSDFLGSGWDIPVATVQFGGVTGISQADGASVAQVEYTYQWVPTEFGQKLGITPYGTPAPLTATLQRFDDGWRLQNLSLIGIEEPKQFSMTTPRPMSPLASPVAPNSPVSSGKVEEKQASLEPAVYIEVFYCHACIWDYSWQKDTVGPLTKAGFHSLTGQFAKGVITRMKPTELDDWQIPVYVGPFPSELKAQQALPRVNEVLKALGEKFNPSEHAPEARLTVVTASVP